MARPKKKGAIDAAGYRFETIEQTPDGHWAATLKYLGRSHETQLAASMRSQKGQSTRLIVCAKSKDEAMAYVNKFLERRRRVASFNNRLVARVP